MRRRVTAFDKNMEMIYPISKLDPSIGAQFANIKMKSQYPIPNHSCFNSRSTPKDSNALTTLPNYSSSPPLPSPQCLPLPLNLLPIPTIPTPLPPPPPPPAPTSLLQPPLNTLDNFLSSTSRFSPFHNPIFRIPDQ